MFRVYDSTSFIRDYITFPTVTVVLFFGSKLTKTVGVERCTWGRYIENGRRCWDSFLNEKFYVNPNKYLKIVYFLNRWYLSHNLG